MNCYRFWDTSASRGIQGGSYSAQQQTFSSYSVGNNFHSLFTIRVISKHCKVRYESALERAKISLCVIEKCYKVL